MEIIIIQEEKKQGSVENLKQKNAPIVRLIFFGAQSLQIIEPLLMTYIRFLNLWNGIKNGHNLVRLKS